MYDVLIVTALPEEHDAFRDAALKSGVPSWTKEQVGSFSYLLGRYSSGRTQLQMALWRPTRMGPRGLVGLSALIEHLKPNSLAMCGVCAGNPSDVALGDVIIAEVAYQLDEGKLTDREFQSDMRQIPIASDWLRAAQEIRPLGLSSHGVPSDEEAVIWVLERLLAGDEIHQHPGRSRYIPSERWKQMIEGMIEQGLVERRGLELFLTEKGKSRIQEHQFFVDRVPGKLPFAIKVGPIASGNFVVKTGRMWKRLGASVRTTLGLEMEAATLASAAKELEVSRWVVIKGVMDHADYRKDNRYKPFACKASAEVLLRFLENSFQPPSTSYLVITDTSVSISEQLPSSACPTRPVILWRDLRPAENLNVFALLDWRIRATPLIGRSNELSELLRWARSGSGTFVRFLVGPGGAGKTRLAFEAADILRREGWASGQVFLDVKTTLLRNCSGLFMVIDYPEACLKEVGVLLRDLARLEGDAGRIRVLLLSRHPAKEWRSLIDASNASAICDSQELGIGSLKPREAADLFRAATHRFAEHFEKDPPEIVEATLHSWLDGNSTNRLPIFVVAAALHMTIGGTADFRLTGSGIIRQLVRREILRLNNAGRSAFWGENTAARVVGLAAASNGLNSAAISRLAADPDFGLPGVRPVDALKSLHLWQHNQVPALTPDLVAAALLFDVLQESPDKAADWLWRSLEDSAPSNVPALGRIAFDIATIYGAEEMVRFSEWLADSIGGQPDRAAKWRSIFENETPIGVVRLAVAIGKCLLSNSEIAPVDRGAILSKLAQRLTDVGEIAEALQCSQEATEIVANLATDAPYSYDVELARSLTILAVCLRLSNRAADGANAADAAVDIWRGRNRNEAGGYETDLAKSLRVWSDCLYEAGKIDAAREATREAVGMWQRLADKDRRYAPELARTLNSLSVDLWRSENGEESIAASKESVRIWERLVADCPGVYEPELALALNNLSRGLTSCDKDPIEATAAIRRAISLYATVVAANPSRFGLGLARSLENLHVGLRKSGEDTRAAVDALRESIEIKKKLALSNATSFPTGTIERLGRLSLELSNLKDEVEAAALLDMIQTAESTVLVLLIRGEDLGGGFIFAYVGLRADKIEELMAAQTAGTFYPQDFGIVIEAGQGEPGEEVRKKMETQYGFNHQGMIDIPDMAKASDLKRNLKRFFPQSVS